MTAESSLVRPRRLVRGALIALLLPLACLTALWLSVPDPARWATTPPGTTALIEQRRAEAATAGRRFRPAMEWVGLERISRRLVDAVVAAEDARFFTHGGFEWEALGEAFRHNLSRGRYARGASTITQQLAKNLALGTEKSLLRKAREAVLTVRLERRLDKRRLLALYLNVAEWGVGVFGAEAAARRHFSTSAAALTTAQAVLLAAMLPAPRRASLAPAPAWLAARARGLLQRLGDEQVIPASELPGARAELERYLSGSAAPDPASPDVEPPADDAPAEAAGTPQPEAIEPGRPPEPGVTPAEAPPAEPGPTQATPAPAEEAPAAASPTTAPAPAPGGQPPATPASP